MRRRKPYHTRPAGEAANIPGDPYQTLIAAILERAVQDALGHGPTRGTPCHTQAQREARAWLSGRGATALLELAGYESAVVLQRVRSLLGSYEEPLGGDGRDEAAIV